MKNDGVRIIVAGLVQGVGYRYFVARRAGDLGLLGFVRNLPDGRVEAVVSGPPGLIDDLLAAMRTGPRAAKVTGMTVDRLDSAESFHRFEIR